MKELYSKPVSMNRFHEYLSKLQGNTQGDVELPIVGFNPMAKGHMLQKIEEMEQLNAEVLMANTIQSFNNCLTEIPSLSIAVIPNIADDTHGAWTNRYTTDFDSKFNFDALLKRNFCVPLFWTSELYSENSIECRVLEYARRTLYRLNHPKPKSLIEHFRQEIFAYSYVTVPDTRINNREHTKIQSYLLEHKDSEDYSRIFNFFYGDEGSESLQFQTFGLAPNAGIEFAKYTALNSK